MIDQKSVPNEQTGEDKNLVALFVNTTSAKSQPIIEYQETRSFNQSKIGALKEQLSVLEKKINGIRHGQHKIIIKDSKKFQ